MNKILQNAVSLFSSVQLQEQDIIEEYSEVVIKASLLTANAQQRMSLIRF
jgi:hypothetical protein